MVVKRGSLADNLVEGLDISGDLNHVSFRGVQNKVIFHEKSTSQGCTVTFTGSHGVFEVHAGAVVQGDFIIGDHATVTIGAKTTFNKRCAFRVGGSRTIQIGQECLLANVKFSTMDDVPVYDQISLKRVNPPADIVVHDRVWIAEHVQVHAGAQIGHDSVIGAWSMVGAEIPAHVVAAGNPAKVVKDNIIWKK